MSRRHQTSRRKAYGRRQHEVRERHDRRHHPELDHESDGWGSPGQSYPFGFLDPRMPRLHYAAD